MYGRHWPITGINTVTCPMATNISGHHGHNCKKINKGKKGKGTVGRSRNGRLRRYAVAEYNPAGLLLSGYLAAAGHIQCIPTVKPDSYTRFRVPTATHISEFQVYIAPVACSAAQRWDNDHTPSTANSLEAYSYGTVADCQDVPHHCRLGYGFPAQHCAGASECGPVHPEHQIVFRLLGLCRCEAFQILLLKSCCSCHRSCLTHVNVLFAVTDQFQYSWTMNPNTGSGTSAIPTKFYAVPYTWKATGCNGVLPTTTPCTVQKTSVFPPRFQSP
jgi:hypothetical protein